MTKATSPIVDTIIIDDVGHLINNKFLVQYRENGKEKQANLPINDLLDHEFLLNCIDSYDPVRCQVVISHECGYWDRQREEYIERKSGRCNTLPYDDYFREHIYMNNKLLISFLKSLRYEK